MNTKLIKKIISLSYKLVEPGENKHLTFIVRKNKIISIGINNRRKTHPLLKEHDYNYYFHHSETDALKELINQPKLLKKCRLINVRISTDKTIRCSKPCKHCQNLILEIADFKETWYTNESGEFVPLVRAA